MNMWKDLTREEPLHLSDCLVMDERGRVFYGIADVFVSPPEFIYPELLSPPPNFVPRYWIPLPRTPR